MTQPLSSLMMICVKNQTIEWPPKTSNREKVVTLIAITEATGGLSNPKERGLWLGHWGFYPNQFHTSAMKKKPKQTNKQKQKQTKNKTKQNLKCLKKNPNNHIYLYFGTWNNWWKKRHRSVLSLLNVTAIPYRLIRSKSVIQFSRRFDQIWQTWKSNM